MDTATPADPGRIIGRKACPWCGFASAHVRQNARKLPYHYCPECGLTTPAKNASQAERLVAGMRPEPGREVPQIPRRPDDILIAPASSPAITVTHQVAGPFDGLLTFSTTLTRRKP